MPASSLLSLCQYVDTQIHLPHLHYLNLLYLCPTTRSGWFPVSPHPYTANTRHTSFISPAFLHSQPPTASLFCHHILRSVSSLTSQVSNSSNSFPHQTLRRPLIQWKMTSPSLFSCKYFIFSLWPLPLLSACCLHPLWGLPWFPPLPSLSLFSPPLQCICFEACPSKRTLVLFVLSGTDAYFVFERALGMLWAQTPKELQPSHSDCSKGGTEQPQGPALGEAMDWKMQDPKNLQWSWTAPKALPSPTTQPFAELWADAGAPGEPPGLWIICPFAQSAWQPRGWPLAAFFSPHVHPGTHTYFPLQPYYPKQFPKQKPIKVTFQQELKWFPPSSW